MIEVVTRHLRVSAIGASMLSMGVCLSACFLRAAPAEAQQASPFLSPPQQQVHPQPRWTLDSCEKDAWSGSTTCSIVYHGEPLIESVSFFNGNGFVSQAGYLKITVQLRDQGKPPTILVGSSPWTRIEDVREVWLKVGDGSVYKTGCNDQVCSFTEDQSYEIASQMVSGDQMFVRIVKIGTCQRSMVGDLLDLPEEDTCSDRNIDGVLNLSGFQSIYAGLGSR
jgi:hypothetical protein